MPKRNPNHIYKKTACELLGITPYQFKKLDIAPVKEVRNPVFSSRGTCFLYDKNAIAAMAGSERVRQLQTKKRGKDYNAIFNQKLGHWKIAIPAACEYLFNLNRYTKHPSCTHKHKERIYQLKNELIEMLYKEGYSETVYLHRKLLPAKMCYTCDGSGIDEWDGRDCCNCGGTGEYLPEKLLQWYVFRFSVGAKYYTWHQPKELITCPVQLTEFESEINETIIKPVLLKKSKFSEAKALIEWVVAGYKKEKECDILSSLSPQKNLQQ